MLKKLLLQDFHIFVDLVKPIYETDKALSRLIVAYSFTEVYDKRDMTWFAVFRCAKKFKKMLSGPVLLWKNSQGGLPGLRKHLWACLTVPF